MMLTSQEYNKLNDIAVQSIKHGYRHGSYLSLCPSDFEKNFTMPARTFVSVIVDTGEYLGCRGNLNPMPFFHSVSVNAFNAAFNDNRLAPMNNYRAKRSYVKINHLYEYTEHKNLSLPEIEKLILSDHSIELIHGSNRALMLSTMQEHFKTKTRFINETYSKAGIKNVSYNNITVRLHKTYIAQSILIGDLNEISSTG
jgi:AMMECR1 domain-containing protein